VDAADHTHPPNGGSRLRLHENVQRVVSSASRPVRYTAESAETCSIRADRPGIRESCALFVRLKEALLCARISPGSDDPLASKRPPSRQDRVSLVVAVGPVRLFLVVSRVSATQADERSFVATRLAQFSYNAGSPPHQSAPSHARIHTLA